MKKIAFTFLLIISFYGNLFAQQNSNTYTLPQLQARFKHANYSEKTLLDFQKTMENLREKPQLNEDIPGEVLSWFTLHGQYSIHKTYLVEKDNVKEVQTIPQDEKFLKKLNSYVPEVSKFSYSSNLWSFAFVKEKLADNFYLIKATAKSFNSHPDIPNDDILIYDLVYKTKDFKEFFLVKLKDIHTEKWTEVND
jgi:hypothetical protein